MFRKSWTEMIELDTWEERFDYLKFSVKKPIGEITFGAQRYLNQNFYASSDWKKTRLYVIERDRGCDLAIPNKEIYGKIYVHHINPIQPMDLVKNVEIALDLENLVCVSFDTHQRIHFGSTVVKEKEVWKERKPGDTKLW